MKYVRNCPFLLEEAHLLHQALIDDIANYESWWNIAGLFVNIEKKWHMSLDEIKSFQVEFSKIIQDSLVCNSLDPQDPLQNQIIVNKFLKLSSVMKKKCNHVEIKL